MVEGVLVMLSPAFCDFGWWLVISLAAALSENLYRWEQPGALAGGGGRSRAQLFAFVTTRIAYDVHVDISSWSNHVPK